MRVGNLYNIIRYTSSKKVGKDVDYAIVKQDGYIYLVFRGTNSQEDVKVDIDFPAKLYKSQKNKFYAHKGFGDAWRSANDIIINEFIIERKKNPDLKVRIIGHSLGGAMALLASEDYHFRTNEKPELITFGCPRVLFNKSSVEYFKSCVSSVSQYAYRNDPVPTVPVLYKHMNEIKVGSPFNIIEMTVRGVYYHCLYGELD